MRDEERRASTLSGPAVYEDATAGVAVSSVDDEFVDELAKCIVRKDNHFQELTGNTVPKEVRMRLQQQLQYDRLIIDLEASSDRQASGPKKKKKKGGMLRSLFKA